MKFNQLVILVEGDEVKTVSPTYFDRLAAGRYKVFKKSPFLGIFLRNLSVVTTFDVNTMAVSHTGNIYINPTFGMALTFDEFVGVLAHEAMHIVNFTFRRRQGRDPLIWNIATDYIMNRDLIDSGFALPANGCIPTITRGDLVMVGMQPVDGSTVYSVPYINKQGKTVSTDITNASAEGLYKILAADSDIQKSEGAGLSNRIDDHLEAAGQEDDIKEVEGSDAKQNNTVEDLKRKASAAIQQAKEEDRYRAIKKLNNCSGAGAGGTDLLGNRKAKIDLNASAQLQPEVNWRSVLRQIICKNLVTRTMSRPHKRTYGGNAYMPRKRLEDQLDFCCLAVDTSGSITRGLLAKFVSEVVSLTKQFPNVSVLVCLWNRTVYYHTVIDKNSSSQLAAKIESEYRTSGTRLSSVAKWIESSQYKHKIRAVIYLTDGCILPDDTYILPPPVHNFAFITVMGRSTGFSKKIPKMKTFIINTDDEI